jgi:hypothetical protein
MSTCPVCMHGCVSAAGMPRLRVGCRHQLLMQACISSLQTEKEGWSWCQLQPVHVYIVASGNQIFQLGWDSPCDQPVCGAHRWWLHAGMWLLQPLVATASWCTAFYAFCIRVGSTLCVMAWCLQCAGKYCIILS